MKNLKEKKPHFITQTVILPVITAVVMLGILVTAIMKFNTISEEQEFYLTEQAVKKAVIQCYANEGFYPKDLDYLVENYFLTIDEKKYYVQYDCFAENIMPDIMVFEK